MFPRGCSRRKPEPSYQQRSQSEGPCRQLSSCPWALSKPLSIELADTDWKYESALARPPPRSLRGIHHSLENHKCSSPGLRLHRLPNSQSAFAASAVVAGSAFAGAGADVPGAVGLVAEAFFDCPAVTVGSAVADAAEDDPAAGGAAAEAADVPPRLLT